MGTLIQSYGPIYGEVVNGTVQGRPNGSVYVPISNRIILSGGTEYIQNIEVSGSKRVRFCNSGGTVQRYNFDALSQDLASAVRMAIFSDAELTTLLASQTFTAGRFNVEGSSNIVNNYELDADSTYYVVAQLMNNGVPVATSDIKTCTVIV